MGSVNLNQMDDMTSKYYFACVLVVYSNALRTCLWLDIATSGVCSDEFVFGVYVCVTEVGAMPSLDEYDRAWLVLLVVSFADQSRSYSPRCRAYFSMRTRRSSQKVSVIGKRFEMPAGESMEVDDSWSLRVVKKNGMGLSHHSMQKILQCLETQLESKPEFAACLDRTIIDTNLGELRMNGQSIACKKWLQGTLGAVIKEHDAIYKDCIKVEPHELTRVSIKMVNVGKVKPQVLLKRLALYNPTIDFNSWRPLAKGFKELGNAYILVYFRCDVNCLEAARQEDGKIYLRVGITGTSEVVVMGQIGQEQREIGFDIPPPAQQQSKH